MRLQLLLPKVDPEAIPLPSKCGYADCTSQQVSLHQPVSKALRDTKYEQVEADRYRCLKCGRTFRVYAAGVTQAQSSERGKGLAGTGYLIRLRDGEPAGALEGLEVAV